MDSGVAALLDGVDLDAASRSLEGVVKPVVKSSVVNATVRDHTDILKRVVQVGGGTHFSFFSFCGVLLLFLNVGVGSPCTRPRRRHGGDTPLWGVTSPVDHDCDFKFLPCGGTGGGGNDFVVGVVWLGKAWTF